MRTSKLGVPSAPRTIARPSCFSLLVALALHASAGPASGGAIESVRYTVLAGQVSRNGQTVAVLNAATVTFVAPAGFDVLTGSCPSGDCGNLNVEPSLALDGVLPAVGTTVGTFTVSTTFPAISVMPPLHIALSQAAVCAPGLCLHNPEALTHTAVPTNFVGSFPIHTALSGTAGSVPVSSRVRTYVPPRTFTLKSGTVTRYLNQRRSSCLAIFPCTPQSTAWSAKASTNLRVLLVLGQEVVTYPAPVPVPPGAVLVTALGLLGLSGFAIRRPAR